MSCDTDYSNYKLDNEFLQDAKDKLAKFSSATNPAIVVDADWVKENLAPNSIESIECVVSNLNSMIENNPDLESYGLHFETRINKVSIRK